jgi:hypothetical protein
VAACLTSIACPEVGFMIAVDYQSDRLEIRRDQPGVVLGGDAVSRL